MAIAIYSNLLYSSVSRKEANTLKKNETYSLSVDLIEKVREQGKKTGNKSFIVEKAVREYLEKEKEEIKN